MINFTHPISPPAESTTRKSATAAAERKVTFRHQVSSHYLAYDRKSDAGSTFLYQATLSPFSRFPSSQKTFFRKIHYFDIFRHVAARKRFVQTERLVRIVRIPSVAQSSWQEKMISSAPPPMAGRRTD
jgi:chemotaxis methyl-accepting protein methylase